MSQTFRFVFSLFAAMLAIPSIPTSASDWPMWRYDSGRTAHSPHQIPTQLHLQWVLELETPSPAWPPNQETLLFDKSYEPVVMGKRIFIPSNVTDSLSAHSTETGELLWRFFADGPVRFAPIAQNGKVYFVSDDGYLYCLGADEGNLVWKVRGGPSNNKVIGNHRLVSAWPARGGPVLYDGVIYFCSSIWPFMGVFIHAVDADSGEIVWSNTGTGSMYIIQPHSSPAFAGVAPQGYLAATPDKLLVAGGRTIPAAFNRKTGEFDYYDANPGKGTGGYLLAAGEGWFVNHDMIFDLETGEILRRGGDILDLPVVSDEMVFSIVYGEIKADHITMSEEPDRKGNESKTVVNKESVWKTDHKAGYEKIFLRSGDLLFASSAGGKISALKISSGQSPPRIAWEGRIDGDPWSMLAADDKLFVVAKDGSVHCFGPDDAKPTVHELTHKGLNSNEEWKRMAESILRETGVQEGYALAIGIGSGGLVEALIEQSELHVVALDSSAEKVEEFRRKWSEGGVYGSRVAALAGDLESLQAPPYMASLVVSEDPGNAGWSAGPDFIEGVFHSIRPYGGAVCLSLPDEEQTKFEAWINQLNLPNAVMESRDNWFLLKREGALPGSADWTHQYGDASNTVVSQDDLVKAPLGLLWFGGPSNQEILPRHGHGPSEQVVGGRLFIEGPDILRAVDVYTGRLLWEITLPGLGEYYDNTGHQPGANSVGSNYVSLEDGVYVAYRNECLRLDPATGSIQNRFQLPPTEDGKLADKWSTINVWGDFLLGGSSPAKFDSDIDFVAQEFRKVRGSTMRTLTAWAGSVAGRELKEDNLEEVVNTINDLLRKEDLIEHLPPDEEAFQKTLNIREEIEEHLENRPFGEENDPILRKLNREALVPYVPDIRARNIKEGDWIFSGVASRRISVLDRRTGEALWSRNARHSFIHNSLIFGDGKVFCIDRLPESELKALSRRGKAPEEDFRLLALHAKTGKLIWSADKDIFGTWLSYSDEHDILLQAGRPSRDMLPEPDHRIIAYRGSTGEILWDQEIQYGGPIMLHGDTLITQGFALSLLSGEIKTRPHPVTGEEIPWTFSRNYGCNYALASKHLLTFRSAAAGFYDLTTDGGTGNIGGFRSGCTSNLVAANGVLNAPDYTRTCICTYQNQSSLALVHMPEAEMWTFNDIPPSTGTVKTLGINFGAPGDRVDQDGDLWMDYPSVGGPSPDVKITTLPENPRRFRNYSGSMAGEGWSWVVASGIEAVEKIEVPLAAGMADAGEYTIRLYFSEPEDKNAGERLFHVDLQGQRVLENFDVAREAGGTHRGVVKEYGGVKVKEKLNVALSRAEASTEPPVLSGIEIKAEEN